MYDFVLWTVIVIISLVMHRVAIGIFKPEGDFHQTLSQATRFQAASRIDFWFEILSVWMPLIVIAGTTIYVVVREYRRQAIGAPTARPP